MPTTDTTPSNPLLTRLQELEQETDFEFVIELIDIYINETPKQIQAIAASLTTKTSASLMIAAHTLKGSSLNLGAKQLGALCLKLEELGRAGKSIPEGSSMAEIENEFENVKTMLLAFKHSRQK
ncbi:MAG: Hpt domain-containing protein [Bacteroidota bacterium]|jgi:HPt (histidine-containing phosphotransfer) domain-containing protein